MDRDAVRYIEAVNIERALVLDNLGNTGKITHWFTQGGECEPADAITCVAECGGLFYSIDLREYKSAPTV